MFRLFWIIFRPFKKQIKVYQCLWWILGSRTLTVSGIIIAKVNVYVQFCNNYTTYIDKLGSVTWRAWWWLKRVETCRPKIVFYVISCVVTDILYCVCNIIIHCWWEFFCAFTCSVLTYFVIYSWFRTVSFSVFSTFCTYTRKILNRMMIFHTWRTCHCQITDDYELGLPS